MSDETKQKNTSSFVLDLEEIRLNIANGIKQYKNCDFERIVNYNSESGMKSIEALRNMLDCYNSINKLLYM